MFAPGYHDGVAPFGTWVVQRAYVDPAWISDQDINSDVAMLIVVASSINPNAASVESVVGANVLGNSPVAGQTVTVTGYPAGSGGSALVCTARVEDMDGALAFTCPGYVAGTSGGPWVSSTGGGQLVGVIGGLHQGGCSPDVSYTPTFSTSTASLLARAENASQGDVLPAPDSDGC